MIHQSIAQLTRNAQKVSSIVDEEKLPDRQRGMWSFLTWSFFLAQAVAAHEAFAKGHGGTEAGADGEGAASGSDDAAQKGLAPGAMLGVSGFDGDPAAAAQFAAALAAGLVTPQMWGAMQNDPAAFQAFVDALAGHAPGVTGLSLDGELAMSAGEGDGGPGDGGSHEGPGDGGSHEGPLPGVDLPGITLPGGITLPIDIAIDLGLELGSDLGLGVHVDGLDDISVNLNAPILGLNLGLDLSGDGPLLSLGLFDTPILGHGDDNFLSGLLGPDLAKATGLPELDLPKLLGPLQKALAPVADPTGPIIEIVKLGPIDLKGLLPDGGGIVHNLSQALPLHDLFANGQHTAYGMEVQSSQGQPHGEPLVASLSANVETLDVGAIADDALKSVLHGISGDYHG